MLWQSILSGIVMMFTHWEIWVGILGYSIFYLLYFSFSAYFVMRVVDKSGWGVVLFYINSFLTIAVGSVLISFLIFFLNPVFSNKSGFTSFSILTTNWGYIVEIGLLSGAIVYVLSFFPWIGKIITNIPGVSELIQCIFLFRVYSLIGVSDLLKGLDSNADIYPGFFTTSGFFIFSLLIFVLLYLGIHMILNKFKEVDEYGFNPIWTFIGILPGTLCLCMYCSYIHLIIQN